MRLTDHLLQALDSRTSRQDLNFALLYAVRLLEGYMEALMHPTTTLTPEVEQRLLRTLVATETALAAVQDPVDPHPVMVPYVMSRN